MANIIRIKRRSTDSTAPTTSQVVNGELAFNENNDILYYGEGGNGTSSSSVIKIGGSGAFLTVDTNQTPTGVKTFSVGESGTLKINGGSNGQVLQTNGSGELTWSTMTANAYNTISDGTNTASASGSDTLKLRADGPVNITVGSNDATHGDNVLFSIDAATTSSAGIVQLSSSKTSTSESLAASAKAVKEVSDVADAALPKAGGTMTGAITLHADPTDPMHAVTKQYVDAAATGLDVKASVRAATTANITLSGEQTIDGVELVAGNRVLVKNQSTASANGIYVVAAGSWSRAADFDADTEVTPGAFTFVEEGTANADSGWVLTNDGTVTVGTTELAFTQFSGAGQIDAGNGLTKSGNTLNVVTADSGRIVVNADNIDLASVAQTDTTGTAGLSFVQSHTVDSYGRVTGTVSASVQDGTTSAKGVVQLTDSTSSSSTTTAATPASVKSAYDLADAALPKAGGTMTGKITTSTSSASGASILVSSGSADPTAPASGDFWNNTGALKFYNGSVKTVAFTDSNITGTAANVSGTVAASNGGTGQTSYTVGDLLYASGSTALSKLAATATGNVLLSGGTETAPSWGKIGLASHVSGTLPVANGGTGVTTFTSKGIVYGNGTDALQVTAAGTANQILSVNGEGVPVWVSELDGGGY
jgi:hypothetical protein